MGKSQNYFLFSLDYQASNAKVSKRHFSFNLSASNREAPVESLKEELTVIVVDKFEYRKGDVKVDNKVVIFGRSRTGSNEETYVLRAQCQARERSSPKNKEIVPSLSD